MAESPISLEQVANMQQEFVKDPELVRAQNGVANVGVDKVALNHQRVVDVSAARSDVSVRIDGWKITDQKHSGRCWLFSSLNLLRWNARQNLGMAKTNEDGTIGGGDLEFSQNYAMFWDKFERANYFLNDAVSMLQEGEFYAEDGSTSRRAATVLETVCDDGGQWNMAVNIYQKYGVVPKEVFPETHGSSDTSELLRVLKNYLRAEASNVADAAANGGDLAAELDAARKHVYNILCIHLGTPPTRFNWSYHKQSGELVQFKDVTPQEFMRQTVSLNLDNYVCLVDDPRQEHRKGVTMGVSDLGNIVGGHKVMYLNAPISLMKEMAKRQLIARQPVWFGCDCRPYMERELGLWAYDMFDYEGVYSAPLKTNKETRVRFGDSAMSHAMLFTGVDLGSDNEPTRWRVENSWADKGGDKGFYTMADDWFDEYMFELAVPVELLPTEYQEALKKYQETGIPEIMLPAWDPMGALA
jgi:bleomycin hydrolase